MLIARVLATIVSIALGGYARVLIDSQASDIRSRRDVSSHAPMALLGLALGLPSFALMAAAATWQEQLIGFWPYALSIIGCAAVGGAWGWCWISTSLAAHTSNSP